MSMPAIYSALGRDEAGNFVIFDDVLQKKRSLKA
jgi:hypothetical protein